MFCKRLFLLYISYYSEYRCFSLNCLKKGLNRRFSEKIKNRVLKALKFQASKNAIFVMLRAYPLKKLLFEGEVYDIGTLNNCNYSDPYIYPVRSRY